MAEVRITAVATKNMAERLGTKTYQATPGLEAAIGFYLVYDHIRPNIGYPAKAREVIGIKELGKHLYPPIRLWRR